MILILFVAVIFFLTFWHEVFVRNYSA